MYDDGSDVERVVEEAADGVLREGGVGSGAVPGPGFVADAESETGSGTDAATKAVLLAEFEALLSMDSLPETGTAGALSDQGVLDVIAAWSALEARCAAAKRSWAGVLGLRRSMNPDWRQLEKPPGVPCVAGDEIAIRLGISRLAATRLVGEGRVLRRELAEVGEALREGLIDAAKAREFVDALQDQDLPVILAVCEDVLPQAPALTARQLAGAIQRAIVSVDPDGAAQRHTRAAGRRRLERPRALADGMARLSAVLTGAQAAGVYAACEAAARAARAGGDARTLEQLRADAMAAMGAQALVEGRIGPAAVESEGVDGGGEVGAAPEVRRAAEEMASTDGPPVAEDVPNVQDAPAVEDAPSTEDGTDGEVGSAGDLRLVGEGAVERGRILPGPGDRSREPAPDVPARSSGGFAFRPRPRERVARATGVELPVFRLSGPASRLYLQIPLAVLRGEVQRGPAVDVAEEIDALLAEMHAEMPDVTSAPGAPECARASPATGNGPPAGTGPPGCDGPPDSGRSGNDRPPMTPLADAAEIVGYGAIDPATARMLAAHGNAAVRVVVWDPAEETRRQDSAMPGARTPWDAGRERHDPPAELARLVRLRDTTCVGPGCSVSSSSCDLDHVIEYPLGPTDAWNLRPLCRRHHLVKTHAGHRLTIEADGSTTWTTPLGQVLRRSVEGRC